MVSYAPSNGVVTVREAEPPASKPEKDGTLILQGPSGKGEYQLGVSSDPEQYEQSLGSETLYQDWEVIEDGENLWLRYEDASRSSHWVAALEGESGDDGVPVWSPWWFSPSAANMEDFVEYVSIDIRLVPVQEESHSEL